MPDPVHGEVFTPQILIEALRTHAQRDVIVLPDGTGRTGRQVAEETSRFIQAFHALGLDSHSRIALLSTNRVEVIHITDAAMIATMLLTSFHPMGSLDDFAYVIEDAAIDTVIFEPKFDALIGELRARAPHLARVLSLGPSANGQDLLPIVAAQAPAPLVAPKLTGDEVYRLSYSGGTTGKPKGIQGTYRCFLELTRIQMAEWEWPADHRHLLVAPFSHSAGTVWLPTLLSGGAFYVIPGFEPVAVMEAIERHRITCMLMVPTMIYAILDHPRFAEFDLSSIETIIYGGAPMSVARLQEGIRRLGPVFFQFFGQSECPMTVTVMKKAEHLVDDPVRLSSCGRPVPWVEVGLLDEVCAPVADGEPGEMCVRGPLAMPGYHDRPELNAEVFKGGWLHTGDIAVRDPDGFLRIVDRARDMVITGGFNVYPREVEDVLGAHPAVAQAAVFGTPDEKWGEMVTAAVVLRPGAEATAEELALHVRAAKGPHQAPKRVHFVDAIPLTNLGKPDKKRMRAIFAG